MTGLELKSDKDSKLEFSGKQSSIKLSSDHLRLYMPFFLADKKQTSIDKLFQYEKNDATSTPGIVILLEKPDIANRRKVSLILEKKLIEGLISGQKVGFSQRV